MEIMRSAMGGWFEELKNMVVKIVTEITSTSADTPVHESVEGEHTVRRASIRRTVAVRIVAVHTTRLLKKVQQDD